MNSFHFFKYNFLKNLFPDPGIVGFYGNSYIIYNFIYFVILRCIVFFFLILTFYSLIKNHNIILSNIFKILKNFCLYLFLFTILFITIIQTKEHIKFFYDAIKIFGNKTYEQKEYQIFDSAYPASKDLLMGIEDTRLTGALKIYLDLTKAEELTLYVNTAYFLYPTINIRSHANIEKPDCLVFFIKKNSALSVPKGYKIIKKINDQTVLAIKEHAGTF